MRTIIITLLPCLILGCTLSKQIEREIEIASNIVNAEIEAHKLHQRQIELDHHHIEVLIELLVTEINVAKQLGYTEKVKKLQHIHSKIENGK